MTKGDSVGHEEGGNNSRQMGAYFVILVWCGMVWCGVCMVITSPHLQTTDGGLKKMEEAMR